ncbi:MAG: cytochrome D ubiquinol oxidase subunit II, partial [Planctomycetes bacterium]|nr:cytochrome D ubiquinol oxidase subunit II [Planctomycetota bacterium]
MAKKRKRPLTDVSEVDVMPTEHSPVLTKHATLIDEIKATADKLAQDNATRG